MFRHIGKTITNHILTHAEYMIYAGAIVDLKHDVVSPTSLLLLLRGGTVASPSIIN